MRMNGFAAFLMAVSVGCVDGVVDVDEPVTSATSQDLLGGVSFGGDCTPGKTGFLDTTVRYGRAVAVSRAFEQCVEQAMFAGVSHPGGGWSGRYRQCNGEPFFGQSFEVQLGAVLDAARSGNDILLNCTGGGGNASTSLGAYDRTDTESLNFSGWLDAVYNQPRAGAWPNSQAAGIVWHEMMHQHGYSHGANDQANAITACGYAGDATWNFQVNTMPYLLGNCVSAVLDQSASTCGNIDSCPAGQTKLVTSYGAATCECVADPKDSVVARTQSSFMHTTTAANTGGSLTTLSHPLLDGHSDAIVQFQHVYSGTYLGYHPVAWYNYGTGRWVIQTQTGVMPLGTAFLVRIGRGVVHRTTTANTAGYITTIDQPLANGNWGVTLTVSPTPYAGSSSGMLDPHAFGTYYDPGTNRWTIFNQDGAAMPINTGFTIDVETAHNRGLHYAHVVTAANRSSYMTRLSSPFLDGKSNARFFATPNWTRGGNVYNTNEFGVWFDGTSWWIYNEANGTVGAAMPIGAAFDIEILKDEVQRWVRVPESTSGVDTGIDLTTTDRVHVHAAGKLVPDPFGGIDGPEGTGIASGWPFPLGSASDFSLIGQLPGDGLFAIGRDLWRNGTSSTQRLSLRTNDWWLGNGSGFYEAEVRAFR